MVFVGGDEWPSLEGTQRKNGIELSDQLARSVLQSSFLKMRAGRLSGLMLSLALSLALAGCNSDWVHARDEARSANTMAPAAGYRADIVAFMHTYLNNPIGVRDAYISEPALRTVENAQRNSVCLRYTARKSDGQYAPSRDSLVIFRQGRLDRVVENGRDACKDVAYQPFPELELMTR
jgi:hypothetical protein